MKKGILAALFASMLLLHGASDAQTLPAKSKNNTSPSPADSRQATAAPSSPALPAPTIAPPVDIASLTAKEILSANNQVVNQVASMYQNLGLFITIIVTLVGGVATGMSYLARKSVHEFIQEWTKKLESVEKDMKEKLTRLDDAVVAANESAKKAAGHERSIENSVKVVDETLKKLDELKRHQVSAQGRGEEVNAEAQPAMEADGRQPVSEPVTADEDAEVSARLKDKINSSEGGGQKA